MPICRDQQHQQYQWQRQELQKPLLLAHEEPVPGPWLPFPLTGWVELYAWAAISNFKPRRSAAAAATQATSPPAAAARERDIPSQASSNNLLLWLLEALKLRSSNYGAQWLHPSAGTCSTCCCNGECSNSSGNNNSSKSKNNSTRLHEDTAASAGCLQGSFLPAAPLQQDFWQQPQQQQSAADTDAPLLSSFLLLPDSPQFDLKGGHQLPQVLLQLLVCSPHPAAVFYPPALHAVAVLLLLLQSYPSGSSSKLQQLLRAVVGPQLLHQVLAALPTIAAAIAIAAAPQSTTCTSCGCCCALPLSVQHTLQQLLQREARSSLATPMPIVQHAASAAATATRELQQPGSSSSSKRKKRPLEGTASSPLPRASLSPASDLEYMYSWSESAAPVAPDGVQQQAANNSKSKTAQILITAEESPCLVQTHWKQKTPGSSWSSATCISSSRAGTPLEEPQRPPYRATPFSPWGAWSVSAALCSTETACCFPPDSPCGYWQQQAEGNSKASNSSTKEADETAGVLERSRRPRRWDVEAPLHAP